MMAGDAAEAHAEVHPSGHGFSFANRNGKKSNIVGVVQGGHFAAAIESDIEFTRQSVHFAVIQNVMMHFGAERLRINQLLRINTSGGRAGHVANIVCTRALAGEAAIVQAREHMDDVSGRYFAQLEIRASGDVRKRAGKFFGDISYTA